MVAWEGEGWRYRGAPGVRPFGAGTRGGDTGPLGIASDETETGAGRVLATLDAPGAATPPNGSSFFSAFGVVAVELGADSSLSEMVARSVETSSTCSTSAPSRLLAFNPPFTPFGATEGSSSPVNVSVSLSLEASATALG